MTPETAALIAAAIAMVASLVSLYVNSRLTLARERRQQLWQYDEDARSVKQDLSETFKQLTKACDTVLKRKGA